MGSLPVANVQALAGTYDKDEVPPRYERPERMSDHVICDGSVEIPLIDFHRLLDPESSVDESANLDRACEEWGFFQLINHTVPAELIERMKVDIVEFFMLPLETKNRLAQQPGQLEGYGQLFVVSEEQKLDWADMLYLSGQPVCNRNMKLWQELPVSFRTTLDKYSLEVKKVADCLLGVMAKNLGLKPEVINAQCHDGIQSFRINYYPPCLHSEKVLGFSQHSDADLLTLVLQVNQVQGLQVKKNCSWVPVKPLHGALVVNVGDIFEIFTNGRYRSIEHRAIVNKEQERLSIAAFHSPNIDTMIGPLRELVKGADEIYKTMDHENFMRLFFSSKLDGKSFLDCMKLKIPQ
ncbi:S-norcoclaurine synthase 1-like [Typha angustifolia]|uniref:S-norcoclaurine synthase 1-like n=1 Tax=Typha angustifolia TaxID=59011 RepID=UPI003C2C4E8F